MASENMRSDEALNRLVEGFANEMNVGCENCQSDSIERSTHKGLPVILCADCEIIRYKPMERV